MWVLPLPKKQMLHFKINVKEGDVYEKALEIAKQMQVGQVANAMLSG